MKIDIVTPNELEVQIRRTDKRLESIASDLRELRKLLIESRKYEQIAVNTEKVLHTLISDLVSENVLKRFQHTFLTKIILLISWLLPVQDLQGKTMIDLSPYGIRAQVFGSLTINIVISILSHGLIEREREKAKEENRGSKYNSKGDQLKWPARIEVSVEGQKGPRMRPRLGGRVTSP